MRSRLQLPGPTAPGCLRRSRSERLADSVGLTVPGDRLASPGTGGTLSTSCSLTPPSQPTDPRV